jgi:hypothetical protein
MFRARPETAPCSGSVAISGKPGWVRSGLVTITSDLKKVPVHAI